MDLQRSLTLLSTAGIALALVGCGARSTGIGGESDPSRPKQPDESDSVARMPGASHDSMVEDSSDTSALCPAAGFAADRPFLGWTDGATVNLLFRDGEVQNVEPFPLPPTDIGALRLMPGKDGWSVATLTSNEPMDQTSEVAILRPDGSTLWQDRVQSRFPLVFAGPEGSVVNVGGALTVIDERGNAVQPEEDLYIRALGGVGAAGEIPVRSTETLDDGSLLDHLYFIQPNGARIDLPAVERDRAILVGQAFHYLQAENADLLWQREGVTKKETVLRVPNTVDGRLEHHGAWVVLRSPESWLPRAVASEDGSEARLLELQVESPPTYSISGNGDWLAGSAEFGQPLWRLNMETGTFEDLSNTTFGARRLFDASFCTPGLVTDSQGRMLLGLRDDVLGGLFREVSGQPGNWEAMGRPVRGVIYVNVTVWGDTVLASAETGEDTFCPDMFGQWPDQTDEREVLEGASVQLFHPDADPRLLTENLAMHESGNCAVLWTPGMGAEILDVPTGTTRSIPNGKLQPVWLQ